MVFVLLDLGSILALIATGAIEGFRDNLPTYQERLVLLSQELGEWLEAVGVATAESIPSALDPGATIGALRRFLSSLGGLFAQGALVLLEEWDVRPLIPEASPLTSAEKAEGKEQRPDP